MATQYSIKQLESYQANGEIIVNPYTNTLVGFSKSISNVISHANNK